MTGKFPVPGDEFEGSYRIEAILGSGGFARVYRALEHGLDRHVALKILRPPVNSAQSVDERDDYLHTLMKRFEREAKLLSQLRSPHTVGLYKYGKSENGLLYMALEYIDGLSLAEILRAGKPLAPERVVSILRQVLLSLYEAHSLKMLHRDLKPANIMVFDHMDHKDQVKLLDFGIAKLVTDAENSKDLTSDGTLIGTPRYMAPEQIQGHETGPAADIYALGFVIYELLTGERAIKDDSSINIIGKQLAPESFKLPADCDVPPGLRYVVDRMIEKRLEYRYSSTSEILDDLERPTLLDVPEIDVELVSADSDEFEIDHEALDAMFAPQTTKRRRWLIALPLLALLIGAFAIFPRPPDEAPLEQPKPVNPVATKPANAEPPPVDEPAEPAEPATQPEVQLTARLNGQPLNGVAVLVNGVERGVTPLTLTATEVADAQLVARYKLPDQDHTVETTHAVREPRDVLFEFDDVVSTQTPPSDQTTTKTVAATPKPRTTTPAPKPKPRTQKTTTTKAPTPARPDPPAKAPANVYVAPE